MSYYLGLHGTLPLSGTRPDSLLMCPRTGTRPLSTQIVDGSILTGLRAPAAAPGQRAPSWTCPASLASKQSDKTHCESLRHMSLFIRNEMVAPAMSPHYQDMDLCDIGGQM